MARMRAMQSVWSSRWPVVALRGVFAVIFGTLAILWPGATLLTLVLLFGGYALASGILSGILAITKQPPQPRWLLALEAVLGVAAGFVVFTQMGLATVTLLMTIGIFAVVAGISRIVQAIRLRQEIENEWALGLSGAVTTLFGIVALVWPAAGAVVLSWTLGFMAIAIGLSEIALGMRLKSLGERAPETRPVPEAGRVWSMRTAEHPEVAEVTRETTDRTTKL